MIPTKEECVELLHKHNVKEAKLKHTLLVEKVSVFLGKKLIEAGIDIDLDILSKAALLHDIGKEEQRNSGICHSEAGSKICKNENIDGSICSIVRKHTLEKVDLLDTWEEKVLFYSDKICKYEIIGIDKRFEPWFLKTDDKEELIELKNKTKQIEKEIFSKLNIAPEDLKEE